jgi:hypothetical protein
LDARRKLEVPLKFLLIDLIYFPPQTSECHEKGKESCYQFSSATIRPQKKRVCNCYDDSDKLTVSVQEHTDSI